MTRALFGNIMRNQIDSLESLSAETEFESFVELDQPRALIRSLALLNPGF